MLSKIRFTCQVRKNTNTAFLRKKKERKNSTGGKVTGILSELAETWKELSDKEEYRQLPVEAISKKGKAIGSDNAYLLFIKEATAEGKTDFMEDNGAQKALTDEENQLYQTLKTNISTESKPQNNTERNPTRQFSRDPANRKLYGQFLKEHLPSIYASEKQKGFDHKEAWNTAHKLCSEKFQHSKNEQGNEDKQEDVDVIPTEGIHCSTVNSDNINFGDLPRTNNNPTMDVSSKERQNYSDEAKDLNAASRKLYGQFLKEHLPSIYASEKQKGVDHKEAWNTAHKLCSEKFQHLKKGLSNEGEQKYCEADPGTERNQHATFAAKEEKEIEHKEAWKSAQKLFREKSHYADERLRDQAPQTEESPPCEKSSTNSNEVQQVKKSPPRSEEEPTTRWNYDKFTKEQIKYCDKANGESDGPRETAFSRRSSGLVSGYNVYTSETGSTVGWKDLSDELKQQYNDVAKVINAGRNKNRSKLYTHFSKEHLPRIYAGEIKKGLKPKMALKSAHKLCSKRYRHLKELCDEENRNTATRRERSMTQKENRERIQ